MLRSRTIAAFALILAFASCRDGTTAPDKPLVVTLTVDAPPSPVITDTPSGPQIECVFGLTAKATGSGTATWQDARTLWYIGPDRTTAIDTTSNPASEVQGALGSSTIAGGQTQHTTWHLYAGAPFEASLSFGYVLPQALGAGGQESVASTKITCGPAAQGAVIPTITQVNVSSPSSALAIGDTITVSYQESGSSGIWMSVINASGAFLGQQVIGEHLATGVNRTARFVVPNGVSSGIPLTISVQAFNAALNRSAKSVETQLKFTDNTPPTLTDARTWERQQHPSANGLAGQYAVGDSVIIYANASDNAALGWLIYELGSPINYKDSIPATPNAAAMLWRLAIGVRPEWVGSPTLSIYARDASGLTSQSMSSPADSLRFYPVVNHPVTAPMTLSTAGGFVDDMVYDAKRDLLYVGVPLDNRIVVFSPTTMAASAPITLPDAPAGMDLSLSGDSLFVAVPSANVIDVFDLTKPSAPPTTIRLSVTDSIASSSGPGFFAPAELRLAANGKLIVVLLNGTPSQDEVVEVDLATGLQKIRTDARGVAAAVPSQLRSMGRNDDRSRLYILGGCVSRYDAATDTFVACQSPLITGPDGDTFDATGSYMTFDSGVLDRDAQPLWTADPIDERSPNLALSPDGSRLYLGALQGLTTMRLSDKIMLERMTLPVNVDRIWVAPSGAWLLAFQRTGGARVVRIDLQ